MLPPARAAKPVPARVAIRNSSAAWPRTTSGPLCQSGPDPFHPGDVVQEGRSGETAEDEHGQALSQ